MATITRFEDIEAWKEARVLTGWIYEVCRTKPMTSDYGLCDQIRRSGVSVMANIAEGFGRGGTREFVQFLSHSKGSVVELKSHFYVMLDVGYISEASFQKLYKQADFIEVLISGFMTYLQKTEIKGRKFKPSQPQNSTTK